METRCETPASEAMQWGGMWTSGGNVTLLQLHLETRRFPTISISSGSTETLFIDVYSDTKTQVSNITEIQLGTTETLLIC